MLLHCEGRVLLQRRAGWSHQGGTWSVPGGALDRGESALMGARREAREEAGLAHDAHQPTWGLKADHATWAYTTVVAEADTQHRARPTDAESDELRWVGLGEVDRLPLHPAFAEAWATLRWLASHQSVLVVDVANVMGARPDGWWRDRPGSARLLLEKLAVAVETGLEDATPTGMPRRDGVGTTAVTWWPETVAVVEGRARAGAPEVTEHRYRVVHADASGDDRIVTEVNRVLSGSDAGVVVVTSDRALAERVRSCGAEVRGARWLRDQIER